MAKYHVEMTVDAVVRYMVEVEADSPAEAAKKARDSEEIKWGKGDVIEYDARNFVALNEDFEPIEETQQGDTL